MIADNHRIQARTERERHQSGSFLPRLADGSSGRVHAPGSEETGSPMLRKNPPIRLHSHIEAGLSASSAMRIRMGGGRRCRPSGPGTKEMYGQLTGLLRFTNID